MNTLIGQPIDRVDAPAKVLGTAVYAAEFGLRNLAYASLVPATFPADASWPSTGG